MPTPTRVCLRLALLAGAGLLFTAAAARADLADYVRKPDGSFAWKLQQKITTEQGTVYDLRLTSQTWQGIVWTHQLQVYQPKDATPNATLLLWNTGGAPSINSVAFAWEVAARVKAPIAFLYQIPNQPLFDGKKEDALIAETFVRYLETQDADWPLLFPMVKSVVRSMDALQAFAREEWKFEVKRFVVSGASKRGWTAWLTGALGDPRVVAIAPLVIDTLNMQEQMAHQKASFGAYSEMIRDYVGRGLVPLPPGDAPKRLWGMVDPYFYRAKLKMPKMLINGNNDPYWTVDALNLYWDGLEGEKYVTYVPNAGHNLRQKEGEQSLALASLSAFVRHQTTGKVMPKLAWKHDDHDGKLRLTVQADPAPAAARLWLAQSPTRDFRKAKWEERAAAIDRAAVRGEVPPPQDGFLAFYAALDYEIDGIRYTLSTQIRVAGRKE
jgi:PhoPQ-activated pathogenicity-related protein